MILSSKILFQALVPVNANIEDYSFNSIEESNGFAENGKKAEILTKTESVVSEKSMKS